MLLYTSPPSLPHPSHRHHYQGKGTHTMHLEERSQETQTTGTYTIHVIHINAPFAHIVRFTKSTNWTEESVHNVSFSHVLKSSTWGEKRCPVWEGVLVSMVSLEMWFHCTHTCTHTCTHYIQLCNNEPPNLFSPGGLIPPEALLSGQHHTLKPSTLHLPPPTFSRPTLLPQHWLPLTHLHTQQVPAKLQPLFLSLHFPEPPGARQRRVCRA